MPGLETRIKRIEAEREGWVEGRDPRLIDMMRDLAESCGRPFNVEDVPRGVPVGLVIKRFIEAVSGKSRGLPRRLETVVEPKGATS